MDVVALKNQEAFLRSGKSLVVPPSRIFSLLILNKTFQIIKVDNRSDECNVEIFLYIGLALMCIGTTFVFIGMGEQQGFKTTQLRMTGPVLIFVGIILIAMRLLCCLNTRKRPSVAVTSITPSPENSEVVKTRWKWCPRTKKGQWLMIMEAIYEYIWLATCQGKIYEKPLTLGFNTV